MTRDEFRDHLASNLGIKGRGNALDADDSNYLLTVIDNCQGELEQLSVALWPVEDIPSYAVESFVLYCRGTISRFGFDPDPGLKAMGLAQLRYVTADSRSGVGKACYF
jgi:hypothetical protein